MKKLLGIRVFSILTIFLLLLSTLVIGVLNAHTVTKFKDGSTEATITLPGPAKLEVEIPEDANVTTATVDISTVDYGDKYARNPELRITDISDPVVWAYKDVGYGDFGHQIYFNNSVPFNEIKYKPGRIDKTTGIYLPQGAKINSAKINLTGTEYDYWEPGVIQLNPADWGYSPPFDMDPYLTVWNNKIICFFRTYNWDQTNQTDGDLVLNYSADGVNWQPSLTELSPVPDTEIPYLGGLRCGDYHPAPIVRESNGDLWVTWGSESDYIGNGVGLTDGMDRDIIISKITNLDNPPSSYTEITHPTLNAAEDTYSNNTDSYPWAKDDRRPQIAEFNGKMYVTWVANNTGNETFKGDRIGDIMVSSSSSGSSWGPGINLCDGDPWYSVDYWPQIMEFNGKLYIIWVTNNSQISNGTDWDIVYRTTSDGSNWDAPKELSPIDDGDWSDDDCKWVKYGTELYAVWRTKNPDITNGQDFDIVMRCTTDGNTWGEYIDIGKSLEGAFDNKPFPVVFDNELYIFWRAERDGNGGVFVRNYHGDTDTFGEEQQVHIRKGEGDNYYITAVPFNNKLYVAWVTQDDTLTEDDDADVVVRRMTPSNLPILVKLDVGSDGDYEFNSGLSASTVTIDITSEIQSLVNDPPSSIVQFTDAYGNKMVNISLLLDITGPGKVMIDGLDIDYDATLTTRNFNVHMNEYIINRKDTAVDGIISVPLTVNAQNDAKIKLSNLQVEYGIKPAITVLTPVTGRTDALENYFDINWTDYDPDDDALVSLYFDEDKKGYDGTLIVKDLTELDEVDVDTYTWTWDSETMEDGDYYIYAKITDGKDSAWDYSDGYVHIEVREITKPTIDILTPKKKDELAWKSYEIKWTDEDPDSNAKIKLYYNSPPYDIENWAQIDIDQDGFVTSSDIIYEDEDGISDTYKWDISNFTEGSQYKVKAYIEDSDGLNHTDESTGNILITQIPAPKNLSIAGGKKVNEGEWETHDLYPQLEWEPPEIVLDMYYYGDLHEGTTSADKIIFTFNTTDVTIPVSTQLEYGKTYYVTLYAQSILGAQSPTISMTFDVVNHKPTGPVLQINPAKPFSSSTLTCEILNGSIDEDNDPIEYSYKWYKNDEHQAEFDDQVTISSDKTKKNEVWKCEVMPFDGIENGTSSEVSVTIMNSKPSITINSPDPGMKIKSSDRVPISGSISDGDGDSIEYKITSSIDGTLRDKTSYTGGLFTLSKKLSPGEHNITVWASDGENEVTQKRVITVEKADEDEDEEFMMTVGISLIIIVIIVIIIVLLVIRKRRRRGEEIPPPIEEYPAEEGEEDATFDEYGEFKKPEDEEAAATETSTPPPAEEKPPETETK
jgi:hypothetical protein